ncbi:MAG: GIY-YIG nuclease family protein [Thiohalomonadaceae bacterium]
MQAWHVYVVRCADDTLYTGIARDVQRRLQEHNGLAPRGARYTRGRRPVRLCHVESFHSRAEAARREAAIKKMSRRQKDVLITGR